MKKALYIGLVMLTLCGAQLNAADRGDTRPSLTGMQSQDYMVHGSAGVIKSEKIAERQVENALVAINGQVAGT